MSRQWKKCRRGPAGRAAALAAGFFATVFALQAANPMLVLKTRYEVRAGEPAEIPAAADTLEFLLHAKTRQVNMGGEPVDGLVVAPNETNDAIMLAASAKVAPGDYAVTLSATSAAGEVRETNVNVVVKQLATVPNSATRPPVVLLNGWISGFTGACPIATTSQTTFGNLANYLTSDGAPVVYFFDNCSAGANASVEALAGDLSSFLNSIKFDDGTPVQQIDIVAHSLGGLIVRAYLCGLQSNGVYSPPANTLVRDLVMIAVPNFGSFVVGNYALGLAGTQSTELEPGSSLLWNLATWNERGDDLRGVNAIAIAGNQGSYVSSLTAANALSNASDGLVSLTSASLGFAAQTSPQTRVVPYCHVDPSAFTNAALGSFNCNAPGIANVTSTSHYTGQIVRSFLAGTTDWQKIGNSQSTDVVLSSNGAMYFAMQSKLAAFATDMTQVTWGTVPLVNGGNTGTIFYADMVSGSGAFTAVSTSIGTVTCPAAAATAGYTTASRCKIGTAIAPAAGSSTYAITPLSTTAQGLAVTAGTAITINGVFGAPQCSNCKVTSTLAGASSAQTLTVKSWTSKAIMVQLPATSIGYQTIWVYDSGGNDAIGVMAVGQSVLSVDNASEQFSYTVGGSVPATQSFTVTNTGSGTLTWTASTSSTWLSLSATSGTAPTTVTVTATPATLAPGTYTGTIVVTAAGASNTPYTINATLTITAAPSFLIVAPTTLSFAYTAGNPVPVAQTLSISNGGGGTIAWIASSGTYWASPSPTSGSAGAGSAAASVSVSVIPGNLPAGNYQTNITIGTADGSVSAVVIPVTLTVVGSPPAPAITGVGNAASGQPNIASATWISIYGTNLSQNIYTWQTSDFVNGALPTTLEGVTVTIDGLSAYISYISPTQINVLVPDDATVGPVQVQVTTAQQASNSFTVQKTAFAPALFAYAPCAGVVPCSNGAIYGVAQHLGYSLIGKPGFISGVTTTPATAGETIILYATGFGPSNPPLPTGQLVTTAEPITASVQFTVGGTTVTPGYAGLISPGLYQFNLTLPANLPSGDTAVVATVGGVSSQTGVMLTIQ